MKLNARILGFEIAEHVCSACHSYIEYKLCWGNITTMLAVLYALFAFQLFLCQRLREHLSSSSRCNSCCNEFSKRTTPMKFYDRQTKLLSSMPALVAIISDVIMTLSLKTRSIRLHFHHAAASSA